MNLELHKSKNLLKILNTAIDAGKEIQKVYKKSFNVEIKDDNSPITEADIKSNNLKLNAGHDLNLENLPELIDLNIIDEVSIGHAIITESLIHGLDNVLSQYIKIIK